MSFSSLPQELVDLVCGHLGYTPGSTRKCGALYRSTLLLLTNMAREIVASLCLVSKQILLTIRRILYRQPFLVAKYDSDLRIRQRRADLLLDSLEADDRTLGALVRDTRGIEFLLPECSYASRSRKDVDVDIRTPEWYRRSLAACPQLRHLDLCFTTKEDLHEVLAILESSRVQDPSSSSISTIRFFEWDWLDHSFLNSRVSYIEVFGACRRELIRSADSIEFDNITWGLSWPLDAVPRYPFPVKRLEIRDIVFWTSLAAHLIFFPRSTTNLETLVYMGRLLPGDVLALPQVAGSNLRSLRLQATGCQESMALEDYASQSTENLLPIPAFQSFPLLKNLQFYAQYGLSLTILRDLANFCPLLSNIEFNESYWISETIPHSIALDDVFPESQIPDTLQLFPRLATVHLGILPTTDYSRYDDLRTQMKEKGIQFEYTACYNYW